MTHHFEPTRPGRPLAEILPFTVTVLSSADELGEVQQLRALGYGHHLPDQAAAFGAPDPMDLRDDVIILVARDKATQAVVGSCRVQHNSRSPLLIETAVQVPEPYSGHMLSESTRLVVHPSYKDPRVRMALIKSVHLYNVAHQIYGVVAGARPSLVRIYRSLGFSDLQAGAPMTNLPYAGGIPHRVLWCSTTMLEADWRKTGNPAYKFFFGTWHPDIRIFSALHELSLQRGRWSEDPGKAA